MTDNRQAAADYLAALTDAEAAAFMAEARGARDGTDDLHRKLLAAVSKRRPLAVVRDTAPEPPAAVPPIALNDDNSLRAVIASAFNAPVTNSPTL